MFSFSFQVLVYLQLYKNVTLMFLDGWQEVTNHVCAVTKALSKRPFKYASSPFVLASFPQILSRYYTFKPSYLFTNYKFEDMQ